ncbi:MAG: DoxX family protein [Chromatiaceae bacterium]|nr:DoxX family protein [Chromatiaceae bacterium]MCP5421400.1 DoxX family protein [Chromatiaceae bacterium]
MKQQTRDAGLILVGRILLSGIFIVSGLAKIGGYAATQGYMDAMGVPGVLLPGVIALEVGAGAALLLGLHARLAAVALALFSVAAGLIFHADLADQMQRILLMKNFAIAGGLLMVAAAGAGRFALRPGS